MYLKTYICVKTDYTLKFRVGSGSSPYLSSSCIKSQDPNFFFFTVQKHRQKLCTRSDAATVVIRKQGENQN